ncbi:MAG: ATP phosphoribosyltransferase regulatory subunit [Gammaproteobacteria bacterium]|nr:ATP phosphoribosyltransferase regulatory subunit [Gammaproteobacteria bacterium]
MQQHESWLLPEGIEEILPREAIYLENLRGKLLRLLSCWGYELVIPPMIDFIDSLLTGSGHDLDLQTFKLIDQVSGKTLGIRADMTPQVARMDAHQIKPNSPARLCYAGTVLHTRGDPLDKTRSPMQIGAELYGHAGIESDIEIISLMLEVLAQSGILDVHLDLGHVGIFQALSSQAGLTHGQESLLFNILQRKARPELEEWLGDADINTDIKQMLAVLPELNGGLDTINKARNLLVKAEQPVNDALANLEAIAGKITQYFPALPISFDFAELRGYHYHTGVVFAAFVPMVGKEIARGGRYDNIGAVFGRARPATGFSADLKQLAILGKHAAQETQQQRILAPYLDGDNALEETIRDLRAQGYCVIKQLPGQQGTAEELRCTAVLEQDNHQRWVIGSIA